ncbi:type II secretion system F family protein [Loktanella sp. SALINAS62]|uniref:type II secretion system F family protein n=1 Tax=Loktanella sp. SALINAS62 TaxID=2706124 RepID=UPI001B8BFD18|nr:type II secretion system F family protein [Loktanella sp. SALINAS62]MBS1300838.1 type II secretion system F family protein [Loktanella sp. SALINAS62]
MNFLNTLNVMITDTLGPFGPIMLVGVLGVVMILATLPVLLKKEVDPLDRLKASTQKTETLKAGDMKQRLREEKKKDQLEKYATFLEPQNEADYSAIKLKLLQAGYKSRNAVRNFYFAQFALAIIGLTLGCIYAFLDSLTNEELTGQAVAFMVVIPGGAGYMFPKYWVTRRQASRREAIENGFPDSLDLMLVCVEAGQSLDQSIMRVARELKSGFPDLSSEYEMVSQELKAGKDKESVMRDMAERCGTPDITSFVTVLIQSQQFGTSIADALRVYAGEMRDKRVMRAEEKANKLPTKMTLATMMLTVPPLLLILIGPSVYSMGEILGSTGG